MVWTRTGIAAGSNFVLGFLIKVDVHFFFPWMLTVAVDIPNQCMTQYLCVITRCHIMDAIIQKLV